uniref:Uncharacterized protein n=1 Tax=Anguilla anguilla TaxID=7936 RepID=A0A0E9TUG2_ANGAN
MWEQTIQLVRSLS